MTKDLLPPSDEQFETAGQNIVDQMKKGPDGFIDYMDDSNSDWIPAFKTLQASLDTESKERLNKQFKILAQWDSLPKNEKPPIEEVAEAWKNAMLILFKLD